MCRCVRRIAKPSLRVDTHATRLRTFIGLPAACIVFGCVPASSALASVWITNGADRAQLSADAAGDAAVRWGQSTLLVPLHGKVVHSVLPGPDVSRPAPASGLAFSPAVRRTPSGWLLAVQTWDVAGQPVALHLARWKGEPTQLTLTAAGSRLTGTASFQGKPLTAFSPTPSGTPVRTYVYIDCFGCAASSTGWSAMIGVHPKADGSFSVLLRPSWIGTRYRASVSGPNVGATLAPDAQAFATP